MSSKLEQSSSASSILPALKEGQSSLVAPAHGSQSTTPRQRASQWAYETRMRINHCIETDNEVPNQDILELKQELIGVFIVALQQNSRAGWVYLHEVLGLLEPYKEFFDNFNIKQELFHYLERIVYNADLQRERLFDLQLVDSLAKVFPQETAKLRQYGAFPARNYPPAQLVKLTSPSASPGPGGVPGVQLTTSPSPPKKSKSPRVMRLPDGTNPYNTHVPHDDRQILMSKPLTFGDLRQSIADVGVEMAARESIWSQKTDGGKFALALQAELPEEPKEKQRSPSSSSSVRSSISSYVAPKTDRKTPRIQEEPVLEMTGRDAVEYFARCNHTGIIQSIYFNRIQNRHYHPYDLISVHKNKANPEHFVFSTFGVLHVYPDQPAESQSLAEWQREAVLWTALTHIPFFKFFLVRKMFYKWKYNKLHLDFTRRQSEIGSNLLQAVPIFGAALLQVSRLLKELITVKFLPFDTDKTYQLSDFENSVNYKNIQAEKVLEKFFGYCKMVVEVTAEESFKKLKHCEEQVKKKTVFSKDSLHLQKLKKETRELNLRLARSETGRLGNFVKLVDQLIVEHMFHVSKTQVMTFVEQVLNNTHEEDRDGYFKTHLVFTKNEVLGLSPPKERYVSVMSRTLKGIPGVLCSKAIRIDGCVVEQEIDSPSKSETIKSVTDLTRSERRKSTAATTRSSLRQDSHTQMAEGDKTTATSVAGETVAETVGLEFLDTESQVGATRSVVGDEILPMPEMQRQVTATKEDDDLGIATPDLVIPMEERLVVHGEGFMGQYDPLTRANLEEKLEKDSEYQASLNLQTDIMSSALEEIDQYCEMNNWLCDIFKFCQKWTSDSPQEFRGAPAFTIEQRLIELRQWQEKVRNFDRGFTTENGLFYIDCMSVHEDLIPRLTEIIQEVLTFVSEEAKRLANEFCEEMKTVLKNLRQKDVSMAAFAVYAKNYTTYKKNGPQYQQRVSYIKSLYETAEEEKFDDNVHSAWEAYMLQLQDASEFVNTQTPLMTQKLEDKYQRMAKAKTLKQKLEALRNPSLYMKLEKEVLDLSDKASTGKFLDPSQNPTRVLADLRKIRDRFYVVQRKLFDASKWRDAICGEPYDLEFLTEINVKMDVRQELWKFVEVSMQSIKEWKAMLFRKINIKKTLEKIIEWQATAGKLKAFLPPGDQVLSYWFSCLKEFKKDLPILYKLANDALKERHWKTIFVGLNEQYDPDKQLTVADLLAFDLDYHSQLIHQEYLSAIAEYDLEQKINQISKFWKERNFKLAKHIPDSVMSTKEEVEKTMNNDDPAPKKPSSPRRRTKLEKYRQERAAAIAGQQKGLNVEDDDFFILIEVEELKYQLEDARISIKAMMQSPFLGDMRQQVEFWDSSLQQVEEITDLWFSCQKKWLYLLKVFERADLYKKYHGLSIKFEHVHNKFKDWMRVVSNDSLVLTVVNRKRGEKGYRLLQGDNLRSLFLQLVEQQEEILKFLDTLIEGSRMEFPRLYFLSNEDLVEMLGISRNPMALLPFAKKCFSGLQNLTYALPAGTTSLNAALDFVLNADKLEVTTMFGHLGEEVPLIAGLEASAKATKWLKTLEEVMKNTMAVVLKACVQARMEDGSKQPIHLLEELSKYSQPKSKTEEEIASEIRQTFQHWLLRFPVQSVLVAEAILWERSVNKVLEKNSGEDMKYLRMNLSSRLEQYVEVLKESYNFNGKIPHDTKTRLHTLLCGLINQCTHHRNVIDNIIAGNTFSDDCFEWLHVLRYHMDIQSVLRAKTVDVEIDPSELETQVSPTVYKKSRTRRVGGSKFRVEPTIEDPPKLTRTKTIVTTDYDFSQCFLTQLGSTFMYDYEYQGPIQRLIITPITERAFLSLTQALKNYYCGTLIGPAGVGKSATVKELAKMCGRELFTVNCNEDITVGMMNQYIMGFVQSGCWALFDDTDRLTRGLMSVTAQHMDYLRTALRTLEMSSDNQYKIRGQARFDKMISMKLGLGDKVIRRNSLTTLHPLPNPERHASLERQKTVPHGFNEKGLVTYFEDTWIAERDRRRRHSIEKEIEIKESDLYKSKRPPPLFYEHVKMKGGRKSATPDYSKLMNNTIYFHHILGNIMFNGKLMQANAGLGCFMTMKTESPYSAEIPEAYRLLMRPCAIITPDIQTIMEITLCCHGYTEPKCWATKLAYLLKQLKLQLPRKTQYHFDIKDMKMVFNLAASKLRDEVFLMSLEELESETPRSSRSKASRTDDPRYVEEHTLVYALKSTLLQAMDTADDCSIFQSVLRDVFPMSCRNPVSEEYDYQLLKAVKDQLREDNLKETNELIAKIMQLHNGIQSGRGVILVGPSGSGKSTSCRSLARAINRLNYLLFAPDHSKDELSTDRDLIHFAKQKLRGMENEPEMEDDVFLSAIDPSAKAETSKGGKKLIKFSKMLGKVSEALQEMKLTKPLDHAEHPKIDVVTLNPSAVPPQEFLGTFSNGLWVGGLLPKILKDTSFLSDAVKSYVSGFKDRKTKGQDLPSILLRWIVLDGVMHPIWTESLNTLLDEESKLSLANSGKIALQDTTAMLFETATLGNCSPAMIAKCSIINFGHDIVHWSSLYECWAKDAKTRWIINSEVMQMFESLVADIFAPTIKFLGSECCTALMTDVGQSVISTNDVVPGIQEVTTFLKMLTAMLDKMYLREEYEKRQKNLETEDTSMDTPRKTPSSMGPSRQATSRMTSSSHIEQIFPNYVDNMKGMFAFAYIWGFGGHIHERFKERFSKFAHDSLYRATYPIKIPLPATVFDYCLDESSGTFMRWNDRLQERMKILAGGFTITPEVEKYTYLVELMLSANQPVLLTGNPGVGKTALLQNMVLPKQTPHSKITMSQGMTSQIFQRSVLAQMQELKNKDSNVLLGPGGTSTPVLKQNQSHLFFIDDLNTAPSNKEGGYQPSLELLRQILSQKGTYDLQRQEFQGMEEAMFLGCSTLPSAAGSGLGKSCQVISSRLTRLFVNLTLFTPPPDGLMFMFGRNIQNWLEEFPTYSIDHHYELSRAMTVGLLELYQRIKEKFRPTPSRAHYLFSLHDVSRVVHGILLMSPRSRTRKMMRRKKGDPDSRSSRVSHHVSRQASVDSRARTTSVASITNVQDPGQSAPMMKIIGQLWCHECNRIFADRLVSDDEHQWYGRILEEIVTKHFCMPRDDYKTEMAAISEETSMQSARGVTPPNLSPPPMTPSESDDELTTESELQKTEDDSKETDDQLTSTDGKSNISVDETPPSRTEESSRMSVDGDRRTGVDSGMVSSTMKTEGPSESDYETEVSEETEESSEEETTETETDIDTPRDLLDSKLLDQGKDGRESSVTASVQASDSKSKESSTKTTTSTSSDKELARVAHSKQHVMSLETPRSEAHEGGRQTVPSLKAKASGNMKLKTVTFKAGLLADWEHEAYFGPLMSMEEIKGSYGSLTEFIFSKFYMTTHTEAQGLQVEKGYVEGSEEMLGDALNTCLNLYNNGTSQRLELVFFKEAVHHAARLSRVLAIQGGHAVLLGMSYSTGRATLVRLAAYIAHCKLFEPKLQTDTSKNLRIVHEHIKRACNHSGVLCKPTVLLIHEDLGTECLQDVACLMSEGTSPGLYSEDELQTIVSQMMPGGVQTKRVDKIEQAFERFLKKIRQNLHVIVCLNYKGNSFSSDFRSLHEKLCRWPSLIKHAVSVDAYRPWNYRAYVRVADVWLRDQRSKIEIPWHQTRMLEQMNLTSQAMAYMHMSSQMIVERQFCHQKEPLRVFSPLTYMEFVHLFRVISAYIVQREVENIGKQEQALGKVNEAFGSISEYKRQVSDLTPQHKAAMAEIKDLVQEVEDKKEQYIQALDKCKDQEHKIEQLQGPLEELRKEAQTEFDKVNPNYHAALTALEHLHHGDIDEVRSFREPPESVQFVMTALCLLFNQPQDWDHAKLLMIKENFMDQMMFYDKDNIPDSIYTKLGDFINHPHFQPDYVGSISVAAMGICIWVHAVYNYAHIHRNMQPRLRNLLEHEEKFTQAQAKLGQLRVEANRIKSGLERKITVHRNAVKRAKTIEKHMQNIEKKIARSVNLMEHMSMQHFLWKSELRKARHNVLTAPGDALITAACVVYHGPLSDRHRAELIHDWLDRCKQGNFTFTRVLGQDFYPLNTTLEGLYDGHRDKDSLSEVSGSQAGDGSMQSESTASGMPPLPEIRTYKYLPAIYDTSKYYKSELRRQGSMEYDNVPDDDDSDDEDEHSPLVTRNGYLLQELLSDFDELSQWRLSNLPTDLHSVQNALLMRVSCFNRKHCWPLLIDPDNQAEIWVKTLQNSRNIFSERDVQEESGDLLLPLHLESGHDKESTGDPPPSRGTALTFSDALTEYTLDDRTDRTGMSTATSTYTTDYMKSNIGRHSRNSFNSDELRPLTSITASWETYSQFRVEQSLEHPEHNLWIVEADNPSLDSKLMNAVVHGVTLLITHLERKPLDPIFRGLLLKHFSVDKDGNKVIKVGPHEFRYHPNFCLYLSTSLPLFLKGDGLHNIPLHRMCIINMAMSDEAILNHLLIETMKVERKEFEGQKRSNENDIIMHRQRLVKEHEMIREKTLNLEGPLLEDQTMLNSLLECQKEVEKNRQILEETRFMGDHLEEKFAHYMPMIMQSAVLFSMIKRMSTLHPYYYLPFYKFIELFSGVIQSRDRGKGSFGAPQARAQELADATSTAIFKYVSFMMFEQHYTLLQLLVAMERMRMSHKASTKELSLFINGFDKQGLDETSILEHKLTWMDPQAFIDCLVLEQIHHPFHGLRRSFIQNSAQWQEYFQHPIMLMNPVPGTTLQDLSVFQKCILWKICCPHRMCELTSAMTLYELGSVRRVADHYDIREVYNFTDNTSPVVFVSPSSVHDPNANEGTKGHAYVSPAHEVKRLAKEAGMEGKIKIINFGVKGQMAEVTQAIEDCIQNGYWLLIQNYHLSDEPQPCFYKLLKDIVYSKWIQHERRRQNTEIPDDGASLVTYSKPECDPQDDIQINDTFRLWITTQASSDRLIPGVLVQHGIKVTCEKTGNFRSTLQKSYRSVAFLLNNWTIQDSEKINKSLRIMPLALLHSLLLQQSFYNRDAFVRDYHWTLSDLALGVELFKKVMNKCSSIEGVQKLMCQTYADHCTDMTDARSVWSLVSVLAEVAAQPTKQAGEDKLKKANSGILKLLRHLTQFSDDGFSLKRAVESMEQPSANSYGLPASADNNNGANCSRVMVKDLVHVIGAPELFLRVTMGTSSTMLSAESILPTVMNGIQKMPSAPETNKNQVNPIDVFLHYEVEGYKSLLEGVQSDLGLLNRQVKGEIMSAPYMDHIIHSLNSDKVPEAWLAQTFTYASSLVQWLKELPIRMQRLFSYVADRPAIYDLSAFQRPDRFMEAVKQAYARKHFKDVSTIQIEIQVMPVGLVPSIPPKDGVFITGLRLYNALWDTTRAVLMSGAEDTKPWQDMPVVWIKPTDTPNKQVKYHLFQCPLYCSEDSRSHGDSNMVTELELPSMEPPNYWYQHRVFLSTRVNF